MSASCHSVNGTVQCTYSTPPASPQNHSHWPASPNVNASSHSSGFFPSHSDHADYGPEINFAVWFLTALSVPFLVGRLYCKTLRNRGLWWDDHVLIASWLALVLESSFVTVTTNIGLGKTMKEFDFKNISLFLLYSNLAGTFSILAAAWSKTSFAITVLRISSGWTKKIVWFVIISVNVALGLSVVFTWVHCTPVVKVWKPFTHGDCWPKQIIVRYNTFTAAYSGAMDIVLAIIPWKIIGTLTMNKKEKFGVLVAMSMGIFAGATSLVKITTLPGIANTSFTDSTVQLVILAAAESSTTIIAASIPILRALVRNTSPTFFPRPVLPDSRDRQQRYGPNSRSADDRRWDEARGIDSWISTDTEMELLKNRLSELSLTGEDGKSLREGEMVGDYEKYQALRLETSLYPPRGDHE